MLLLVLLLLQSSSRTHTQLGLLQGSQHLTHNANGNKTKYLSKMSTPDQIQHTEQHTIQPPVQEVRQSKREEFSGERLGFVRGLPAFPTSHHCQFFLCAISQMIHWEGIWQPCSVLGVNIPAKEGQLSANQTVLVSKRLDYFLIPSFPWS